MLGLMVSLSAFAVSGDTEDIINSLKQGNAGSFSRYFDNFVDIKLPEKDEIKNVGKTQASVTMKSFFDESAINGFELTSQRELSGTMYITGKLKGGAKNYNITLMMKNKNDKVQIITVRIN